MSKLPRIKSRSRSSSDSLGPSISEDGFVTSMIFS